MSLPEAPTSRSVIPAVRDDPVGHVLATPLEQPVARPLVEAATQNMMRALLSGFLHEPPLAHWYRRGYALAGMPLAFHEIFARLLARLEGRVSLDHPMLGTAPSVQDLPEWVSSLYQMCRRLLPAAGSPQLEVSAPQSQLGCGLPWAVRRLAEEMRDHKGLQLYLHGSLATCDATAYSDVDTLLVVSHNWLESGDRAGELQRVVSRAQRWLYRFDPLQHHGFMLVTELDLDRYASWYFPLELVTYAYALGGRRPLHYRVRASEEENVSLLRRLCANLDRLESGEVSGPQTRYALKAVLSEIMLLPIYYLQATGRVVYKRESFPAVRSILSPRACAAMDELSVWRREWTRGAWDAVYRGFGSWLPEPVGIRVLARARGARIGEDERRRWESLLPGVRLMGAELLARAEAAV